MIRYIAPAVVSLFLATVVIACSDDDDAGPGGSSGTSGTSGTSGGPSGSGNGTFKNCGTSSSGSTGSCTEAQMKPYSDCVQDKCKPAYEKCYGPNYLKGTFSGPCGNFITCIQACECNDLSCVQKCVQEKSSNECTACSADFETCESQCTLPECAKQDSDAGLNTDKTCADLGACCDAMAAGDEKDACNEAKGGGNDQACGLIYSSFKLAGLCP